MAFLTDVVKYATNILAVVAGTPRTAASVNGPLQGLANRTAWLRLFTEYLFGPWVEVTGADLGADTLYSPGHGLTANQAIQFRVVGGSLPAPLVGGTVYRVIVVDSDNFKVSLTSGPGPAVNLTGPMASDVYAFTIPDWIYDLLVVDAQWGTGPFADLVAWLAGTQTFTGAKTFQDITAGNGADYKYAGHATLNIPQRKASAPNGGWTIHPAGNTDLTANGSGHVYYEASLPHGCYLQGFSVAYQAAPGHGALPAVMPKLQLVTVNAITGNEIVSATATDSSPNVATFQSNHLISSVPFSLQILTYDVPYTYYWKFSQESGVGALINGVVFTPIARVSPTAVDPGVGT